MWFTMAALAVECGFQVPDREVATVAPKMGGEPELHDAFGSFSTHETPHFALKWGPNVSPTTTQLEQLAQDLESTWVAQVDDLGWLPPPSTDSFKLNVYLGSTGGNIPAIDFEGGYVYLDPDDLPYIVLTPVVLDYYAAGDWLTPLNLIAHEFNHTLQLRAGLDGAAYEDPFFWEATANFMVPYSTGLEPDLTAYSWSPYLINPHLSFTTYGDPLADVFRPRGQRQYQAAMFLYDLAENQGFGQEFIRDTWHTELPEGGLIALDEQLNGQLDDHYAIFAVTHAARQHPLAGLYDSTIDLYMDFLEWEDRRIADQASGEGTDGWQRVDDILLPEGLSWNQIRWNSDLEGTVSIAVRPDPTGDEGTPSRFQTWIVERGDSPTWTRFDERVELLVDTDSRFDLVVVTGLGEDRERFGYEYEIAAIDASVPEVDPVDPDIDRGESRKQFVCGCSGASASPAGLLLLLPLLLTRRSR